jgi:hypothetical protein
MESTTDETVFVSLKIARMGQNDRAQCATNGGTFSTGSIVGAFHGDLSMGVVVVLETSVCLRRRIG